MTFAVFSNANNIHIIKEQLKIFQIQQVKRLNQYSLRSNRENRADEIIPLYDCKNDDLKYISCETEIVKRIPEVIVLNPFNKLRLNMAVPVEVCRNPDKKCKFHEDSVHRNKQSLCKQVYSNYTLYGMDAVDKNTFNTTFRIEFGCQCVFYENGKKVGSECPRNKYMVCILKEKSMNY